MARKKSREEQPILIQIRVFSESADLEPRRVCRVLESVNAVVQGDRREHETQHLTSGGVRFIVRSICTTLGGT